MAYRINTATRADIELNVRKIPVKTEATVSRTGRQWWSFLVSITSTRTEGDS
ncbi:MAG: hypothetical protein QXO15_04295 [Nitrososphaerota archaeon]